MIRPETLHSLFQCLGLICIPLLFRPLYFQMLLQKILGPTNVFPKILSAPSYFPEATYMMLSPSNTAPACLSPVAEEPTQTNGCGPSLYVPLLFPLRSLYKFVVSIPEYVLPQFHPAPSFCILLSKLCDTCSHILRVRSFDNFSSYKLTKVFALRRGIFPQSGTLTPEPLSSLS